MKVSKGCLLKKEKTIAIYCNKCADEIKKIDNMVFADFLEIKKQWGYFSETDGEAHSFDICQKCYKEYIDTFKIPVDTNSM